MEDHPILLEDLIHLLDEDSCRVKVRLNIFNGEDDPMKIWLADRERVNKEWLFWHKKQRYFREGDIAICLVRMSHNHNLWLLTTIHKVTKVLDVENGVGYEGYEIEKYKKYFGRVVISYHKPSQAGGRLYKSIYQELIVNQILPADYEDDPFPGYDNVRIDFPTLERIVSPSGGKNSWTEALEHQKAIYLITDKSNGRLYVGSAYNENGMLLGRWRDYAATGHGHDVKLRELIKEQGIEHARKYFQFSILEIFGSYASKDEIINREHWWMDKLDSRKHGYNSN